MTVTCLIENTKINDSFYAEHGLSFYIKTKEHNILFDMGQSDLFAQNAQTLGIDLADVDIAILSHGHYDHGGGLAKFLELNKKAPVYISRHAFEPHYNGTEKYIGLDISLKDNNRLKYTDGIFKIDNGLTLFSHNETEKRYDLGSFGLTEKQNDEFVPDSFRHEHYLLIEEAGKKVVFSGCSHKGILDIAEWFDPDVLIGGFHFSKLPLDEKLSEYADILSKHDTDFYTCHCTGTDQFEFMKKRMNRLFYISSGQTVNF